MTEKMECLEDLLKSENWESALQILAGLLHKDPHDHDVWELVGEFFESQADNVEFFRRVLAYDLQPLAGHQHRGGSLDAG